MMTAEHVIRLRGPWQYSFDDASISTAGQGRVARVTDLASLLPADFTGTVRWTRRFHWVAALAETQQVYLAIERAPSPLTVAVNETPVPGTSSHPSGEGDWPSFAAAITHLLRQENTLEIVQAWLGAATLAWEARLVITPAAASVAGRE